MKIAILYICTGKYDVFWSEFYDSCKKMFCPEQEKHFFVFTDSQRIHVDDYTSIIYQDNLGWPFNTLYRYKMFLRIKEELLNFDKVVFFNGNCVFVDKIKFNEFFGVESKLLACLHPGFFNKNHAEYTYEKRDVSKAFVTKPWKYFAGGINGGDSQLFLDICHKISENIENDLRNGIVALWHDESHWNALLNNERSLIEPILHILSPAYLYPNNWEIPFSAKIRLRDKNNYGGHGFLRGEHNMDGWIKIFLKFMKRAFRCR